MIPNSVNALLNRLRTLDDGRMADVIEFRFGIRDGFEHTLEEIGTFLGGLTRERIRQIEGRALQFLHRFAVEAGDFNPETGKLEVMDTLYQLRQTARLASKTNRNANRLTTPEPTPTAAELAELRKQVSNGMAQLQSLGIRVTA